MADPYLTDLQPGDSPNIRRLVIQRWCHAMAEAFKLQHSGYAPTTGGYLVDVTPQDTPQTTNCATVAWVKNASDQLP